MRVVGNPSCTACFCGSTLLEAHMFIVRIQLFDTDNRLCRIYPHKIKTIQHNAELIVLRTLTAKIYWMNFEVYWCGVWRFVRLAFASNATKETHTQREKEREEGGRGGGRRTLELAQGKKRRAALHVHSIASRAFMKLGKCCAVIARLRLWHVHHVWQQNLTSFASRVHTTSNRNKSFPCFYVISARHTHTANTQHIHIMMLVADRDAYIWNQ